MSDSPYLPLTDADRERILRRLGLGSIEELIDKAVPEEIQYKGKLPMPDGYPAVEVEKILRKLAEENTASEMKNFAGGGAYQMYVPPVVDEISSRPEFYTAYTPYQPEVSQGTLTAIFEFQSMITALTGMEIANASMYDGASATAESAILSIHQTRRKKILYSQGLNPLYLEVLRTYLHGFDAELVPVPLERGMTDPAALANLVDDQTACFILQNPNFFGVVEDGFKFADLVHEKGALFVVVVADPMSLGILTPPGDYGADVVVGEAQQFGNYLYFGGPYVGFFAARRQFLRSMPGRIIGMTKDVEGKRGFVMVFQTREQHIRRARATSNICSNQQLCALRSAIYLALVGEKGLTALAKLLYDRAHYLADKLAEIDGVSLMYEAPFFREFAVKLPVEASKVVEALSREGIIPGIDLGRFYSPMRDVLLVASSDLYGKNDMDELVEMIREII